MSKVTVFSCSNRNENQTKAFASLCSKILESQGVNAELFSLQDIPANFSIETMYDFENSPLNEIVEKYLAPVDKLVFVIPEYNGSFPGIVKLFLDAIHPSNFKGKKAAVIGVSSGRTGNVRGLDHLTNILNYLKVDVFHHKMPIASIDLLIENGQINDDTIIKRLGGLIEDFMKF